MSFSRLLLLLCLLLSRRGRLAAADYDIPVADYDVQAHYSKQEFRISMRDGTRLFTAVYVPKNAGEKYPILLTRTPYSVEPYGPDRYPKMLGPSRRFDEDGFVFVFQDVRGRYLSEGQWLEMTPAKDVKHGPADVDESTDMFDTVEWLLKNVPSNGKAGALGISYPGFYTTAGLIAAHPALLAASPQAPVADLYMGDDAYHNGAFFLLANFSFYTEFARQNAPTLPTAAEPFHYRTKDGLDFYLRQGPLTRLDRYFHPPNPYWTDARRHTTYDEFWKARNILPHLRDIKPAVLIVGGWFDAEDLAGTLKTYHAIGSQSPGTSNRLVMGPWVHGGWEDTPGSQLGDISFASNTSDFFQNEIALPFFRHYLKNAVDPKLPKAYVFETGENVWRRKEAWPPMEAKAQRLYLGSKGTLTDAPPLQEAAFDQYLSDPRHPVPFFNKPTLKMDPNYMDADQRFLAGRTDVLRYQTEPLARDLTIAGPISPWLFVSTSGTDSDFVVKLIDVYPASEAGVLAGYEQLVRGEPFRAKFRDSFETPRPLTPGEVASIHFSMPDAYHCFRRGHRVMVQVQSSWFPLVDRNPQTFTNIPQAKRSDFKPATERIYHSRSAASYIEVLAEP